MRIHFDSNRHLFPTSFFFLLRSFSANNSRRYLKSFLVRFVSGFRLPTIFDTNLSHFGEQRAFVPFKMTKFMDRVLNQLTYGKSVSFVENLWSACADLKKKKSVNRRRSITACKTCRLSFDELVSTFIHLKQRCQGVEYALQQFIISKPKNGCPFVTSPPIQWILNN